MSAKYTLSIFVLSLSMSVPWDELVGACSDRRQSHALAFVLRTRSPAAHGQTGCRSIAGGACIARDCAASNTAPPGEVVSRRVVQCAVGDSVEFCAGGGADEQSKKLVERIRMIGTLDEVEDVDGARPIGRMTGLPSATIDLGIGTTPVRTAVVSGVGRPGASYGAHRRNA